MISYNEACKLINAEFEKIVLTEETVEIENAAGRTLAENIFSDINLPPFNNSAVDGFAVKFDEAIRIWTIIGEIAAGNFKQLNIDLNTTVRIMTGAKVPEFTDTVIPIEDLIEEGNIVKLKDGSRFFEGMNIRRKAGDIAVGEIAVEKGTVLKARHLAAAASCGKSKLKVYSKLKIAILATGDELVEINEFPSDDKIRVSNIYSLIGEILEVGQIPLNFGFQNDDRNKIKSKISDMINSEADIILTTGGVSVGKYDYLKEIFLELGAKEIFWKANIKPGKPIYFATINFNGKQKLIFGLPGNPVSSQVNFKVYLKENIERLFNLPISERITAILKNNVRKNDGKRHFVRGYITEKDNINYVSVTRSQSSGNLVELSLSNCLIEIEENHLNPKKGEKVSCIKI